MENILPNPPGAKIHIDIATDCSAVIDLLLHPNTFSSLFYPAHDLTYEISQFALYSTFSILTTKIKSHQDNIKD